jgi:TolB-like protein
MLVERVFFAGNVSINKRQEASIAVLPFDNFSLDQANEGFSKGLAEQISNDLASVSGLKVIAANSSSSFEGKELDDQEIGNTLKVNYLLKGSLQYDNRRNRVKIITRLVNANNGYSLWSDVYEDHFDEIFVIQEDVSRNVVSQLRVRLQPGEEKALGEKLTDNTEAYKLYLESKNFSKKRTDKDLRKAILLLNEAIQLEPNFAEAHAELSYLYQNLFFYGSINEEVKDERRIYHLKKALSLAPDKPEVLWAKASYNLSMRKDSSQVIADLRKAITLKPSYADAHYSLGRAFRWVRARDQQLRSFEKAVDLDPQNAFLKVQLADWYYIYGFKERGLKMMQDIMEKDSAGIHRLALMIAKEPYGDLVKAFKLVHKSTKRDEGLGFKVGFSLNLDLWPFSEKNAILLQMKQPDNHFVFFYLRSLYSFTKNYSMLADIADLWTSEKGLDQQSAALVKADISIHNKNYQEARKIYEKAYPDILTREFNTDNLNFDSNYDDLVNYIEILRLNNDDQSAEHYSKIVCDFYGIKSGQNEYYPTHELYKIRLDCHYLANDTVAFVKALEEQFFDKKDRLGVFSNLKRGVYRRFDQNKEYREVVERITDETHRMRAEVIEYLKEEGDWDSAWDEELGLE